MAVAAALQGLRTAAVGTATALGGPAGLALEGALRLTIKAVSKLTQKISKLNDINERLSLVNLTLQKHIQGNTGALEANTVGFGLAVRALTELKVAGFDEINKNLINLATRTKISGQDTQGVIKLGTDILAAGSNQEGVMDVLSKNIVDNSLKYGTTTDSMVKAVGKLSDNLQILSIMGGTGAAAGLTAELTARLGQENSLLIGRLMKELTSANANLNMQAIVGMEKAGDLITMGLISNEASIQSIIKGGERVAALQSSAAATSRRALKATFGGTNQFFLDLRIASEKLLEAQKPALGVVDALMKTFTVFRGLVLDPLKSIAIGLLDPFLTLIKGISFWLASGLNLVMRSAGPLIAAIFKVMGWVFGVIGTILSVAASIIEFMSDTISGIPVFGHLWKDSDKEQNSTLNTMKKLLGTIASVDKDALGIASDEARGKERDRLSKVKGMELNALDLAALKNMDRWSRRSENAELLDIGRTLNKLLEDKSMSDAIVNKLRDVITVIMAGDSRVTLGT